MKKILYIITYFVALLSSKISFASDSTIKDKIINDTSWNNIWNVNWTSTSSILWWLFAWFKTEIFSVIMVISIAVFIFIGIKFATSRWNPEEFKKAWLHMIYAVIWIFFVFMAWWLVKIVSSLSL